MHSIGQSDSIIRDLIAMLECGDPMHSDCRERGQDYLEHLSPDLQASIQQRREREKRAHRVELEWERRKAAGLTVGGDRYHAMVEEILSKYTPR
jgi:hypothetical protein